MLVSPGMHPIIEVKNLSRSYKSVVKKSGLKGSLELILNPKYQEKLALKNISFSIEEGSFVGLIGENGAGKTTLLKILSGLIPPTSGEARVISENPFDRTLSFRNQISLVMGQKAQLWWDLPALDAFDLLRAVYEIPKDVYQKRVGELTQILGVEKLLQTQIRKLSLGERMKMELIGALLHFPKILFLDEPTIGLDVLASSRLREFLKEFNQKYKTTIILTSHNMDDIEKLCSRVLILNQGEFIFDGSPKGLTQEGETNFSVLLAEKPSEKDFLEKTGLQGKHSENEEDPENPRILLKLDRTKMGSVIQKITQNYTLLDLSLEEQNLENVIQKIYESRGANYS